MTTDAAARRAIAMRTLMLDAAAAEAHAHLIERGIDAIVLKGRVWANWLYDGELREYGDVDLLVSPKRRDDAVDALAELGYRHWLEGAAAAEYGSNEIELVRPGGPCVDLHHVLLGVSGDPERAWDVLATRTDTMPLAGRTVTTLDVTARTMHLALHSAQDGPSNRRSARDLELGLDRLDLEQWTAAAGLAEAVGAEEAFSSGLRTQEAGRALADLIGLARPHDVGLLIRSTSAPPESLQIEHFMRARTVGARGRLVARKLWPTKAYMMGRELGAAGGPTALFTARLRRLVTLPPRFVAAVGGWRTAAREARAVDVDAAPTQEGTTR